MALIIRDKTLSVGVNEMDDQHKKLIEIINNLFEAMKIGMGRETLNYVFSGLIDYAKEHFSEEEELMKKFGFPELMEHSNLHREFEEKVGEMFGSYEKGDTLISIEVLNYLKEWFSDHMQKEDKKYTEYFKSKGII